MTLVTRQGMSDDTGLFTDGTRVNKAFVDQLYDQQDDQCHSSTNPTIKPKAITDEVVAGRGAYGSLDARMDALEADDAADVAISQVMGGLGAVNLVGNPDFQVWPAGDAIAPVYFTGAGVGFAVARAGTGLGDTNRKIGDFCSKVSGGVGAVTFRQTLLSAAAMTRAGFAGLGLTLAVGAWVKCSAASTARLQASDGVTTTNGGYHTGSGNWEFIVITNGQPVGGSASTLWAQLEVAAGGIAYISGLTAMLLPYAATLTQFVACPVEFRTNQFNWLGNIPAAATDQRRLRNTIPFIVKNTALHAKTAPATTAIIMDINHWDGAVMQTMYSTRPQIAAAANLGDAAPDGTYGYRCFYGYRSGANGIVNAELSLDVDQIGTGTVGADVTAEIHCMNYVRGLDVFADLADLGV